VGRGKALLVEKKKASALNLWHAGEVVLLSGHFPGLAERFESAIIDDGGCDRTNEQRSPSAEAEIISCIDYAIL